MYAPFPALGAHPALQPFFPVRLVGVNSRGQLERRRVELEDRKIAKLVSVGIEQLIVVNGGVLSEDPFAIGIQIGLCRLALDQVA